jgi:hypothetical protein
VGGSQVEEELDNHRHWQEAELPLLQRDRARAAELEGEREELLEKLTAAQIGLAEMGETNAILARELAKLRHAAADARAA